MPDTPSDDNDRPATANGPTRRTLLRTGGAAGLGALALGPALPGRAAAATADAASAPPGARPGPGAGRTLFGLVDPLVGTEVDHGKTSPFVGVPFGMTQWSPSTSPPATKGLAPYLHGDPGIVGFRGSHWPSGSAMQDYGSVTLMPVQGTLRVSPEERADPYSHDDENATPSRYDVRLGGSGIRVSMTGTARAGFLRFDFPDAGDAYVVVDSDAAYEASTQAPAGEGWVRISADRKEITGCNPVRRLYQGSGQLAGISGYFVVRFQQAPAEWGTWNTGGQPQPGVLDADDRPGGYARFSPHGRAGAHGGGTVLAKVGTSFVSVEGARANLDAEIPGWDFEAVAARSEHAWQEALGRIAVTGGTDEERAVFSSALYHSMLLPRLFSDVDGACPAFDTGEIKHTGRDRYMDFSMWDTFRAVHPLLALIQPERVPDMVRSLVDMGSEGGWMPIFPMWNSYTAEMIGDHVTATIADAHFKGLTTGVDMQQAYRLMRQSAYVMPDRDTYLLGKGRRALDTYLAHGYVTLDDPVSDAFHQGEQVSRTLEYAYDDFTLARLAKSLGHHADAADLTKRASWYRNVIDPATGSARGRWADGSWVTPFDPLATQKWITESTPWIYTSFVPQDVAGLAGLLGGRARMVDRLVTTFEQSSTTGFTGAYYDHGNEPSHHVAYLFAHVGAPWLTQKWVRAIMAGAYQDTPGGLSGDDDAGQMSAWYVFSAMGLYPVCPGVPYYVLGSPLFDSVSIKTSKGEFRVEAEGNSPDAVYIKRATLNGRPLNRPWLSHEEVVRGGLLRLEMSTEPNTAWGSSPGAAPPSLSTAGS